MSLETSIPQILIDILKALEAGIPLDHGNRPDARVTLLEEAVKAILVHIMGPQREVVAAPAGVDAPPDVEAPVAANDNENPPGSAA